MNNKYRGRIAAIFLKRHLKTSRQVLFYGLISGLLLACPDSPATLNNCADIINAGIIPPDLAGYDQASRDIFSAHTPGAALVAKYVKEGGTGDGSSYATAAGNVKAVLDGITDATTNKVYMVLVAGGTYDAGSQMAMKNNVAIVGGRTCLGTGGATTTLSGGGTHRVFNNSGINNTAVLYGVTIFKGSTKGSAIDNGGGMHNQSSSPTLVGVNFFTNWAKNNGAGMYNTNSSPLLTRVTFSSNWAEVNGGGMYNFTSSPVLSSVTFSRNRGRASGGGMGSALSYPVLVGVSFFIENAAERGGAMHNNGSIYENDTSAGVRVVNTILWGNVVDGSKPGKEIYLYRNSVTEIRLYLYNSVLDGGMPPDYKSGETVYTLGEGSIYAATSEPLTKMTRVFFSNIITNNPGLNNTLANNGGGVFTHAIPASSSAVNQGLYVKRSAKPTGRGCRLTLTIYQCDIYTLYYSSDNSKWYSNPELTTTATPPTDAVDLTATDATGRNRTGRPDLGAYEAR